MVPELLVNQPWIPGEVLKQALLEQMAWMTSGPQHLCSALLETRSLFKSHIIFLALVFQASGTFEQLHMKPGFSLLFVDFKLPSPDFSRIESLPVDCSQF